jgi:two-component system chemotaxis response regulator CheB
MLLSKSKIRVLIIDDSALVRDLLAKGLASDPAIEVVGTAPDVYVGRDKIVELNPDVLTLDIEMPRMDGVEFLRRLMPQYPLPVVVVSSLTQRGKHITMQALEAGAVDFVAKPTANLAHGLAAMMMELRTKVKIASTAHVAHWKHTQHKLVPQRQVQMGIAPAKTSSLPARTHPLHAIPPPAAALAESTDKVIAIGASTGGTEAIRAIITNLPPLMPGIVIVQHMPPGFTKAFADRLNEESLLEVREAKTGDRVMRGTVLVAPGDFQMRVVRSGGRYELVCTKSEKVNGHRPSVDVLMHSVAQYVGANACGVILTGMGGDGAQGLKAMRDAGAWTLGQDEETSVVYGMPKVAFDVGAVETVLPLQSIASTLVHRIQRQGV